MELCDITLMEYLRGERPKALETTDKVAFIGNDATLLLKLRNLWRISSDIAAGLQFLHQSQLAHRDLKPLNGRSHGFMTPS